MGQAVSYVGSLGGGGMSDLVALPPSERLSPRVLRVLGCNPGEFELQGTNTYLVGSGGSERDSKVGLVDCGDRGNGRYQRLLASVLREEGVAVSQLIVTHWHRDHIGGAVGLFNKGVIPPQAVWKMAAGSEEQDTPCLAPHGFSFVKDDHVFRLPGATLRAVWTPGHTGDHMSLWLEEERSLFSGDCVLGQTRPVFEDLRLYIRSLQRIYDLKPQRIYPGHGPVITDPKARIEEYFRNIQRRERMMLSALRSTTASLSTSELVRRMYHGISIAKTFGAAIQVRQHLEMLSKDGVVRKMPGDSWSLVGGHYQAKDYLKPLPREQSLNSNHSWAS